MRYSARILSLFLLGTICLSGCGTPKPNQPSSASPSPTSTVGVPSIEDSVTVSSKVFGGGVIYQSPTTTIDSAIAKDFNVNTIQNLHDMERAYGFTFTPAELAFLAKNKFVEKNLPDTSIQPSSFGDNIRELTQLYSQVQGPRDYKQRAPENAIFYSSDLFLNSYNNIYTELLKEMENVQFYPNMKALTKSFYQGANQHLSKATTEAEKRKWMKVRNYFAVPYAIFENVSKTLSNDDYMDGGQMRDPNQVMADYQAKDAKIDTYATVSSFVKGLQLDQASEKAVLADLQQIYDPEAAGIPAVFKEEYEAYAVQENVSFKVDFTQFTPRGTYTSSSLRRQYFRGLKWYIMVPFFLKSQALTDYSFAVTELMAEHPEALQNYNKLEQTIDFLVGTSDDLMPVDYLRALQAGKGTADPGAAAMAYLVQAHPPLIKDLAAEYPTVGTASSSEMLLKTKGMRFFSGKFILDSYWTGFLTQGDEAIRKGYTQKLPPMASSLEVMTLLGSDYAKSQIPTLDFYSSSTEQAIKQAMAELQVQTDALTEVDWAHNIYYIWLRTIKSLFNWQEEHKAQLPRFMQSVAWEAKTLMTASAWWTELRHATILYAKQSFAEMGGGGPDACDPREVPAAPKAYIEPQLETYARLSFLANRTYQGLAEIGFTDLRNMASLANFSTLMDTVQNYTRKELTNTTLQEVVNVSTRQNPDDATKTCKEFKIEGESDWEVLRIKLIDSLKGALPSPTEGPVLSAKDRRVAVVADIHTGGDSSHPPKILYQGEGTPRVIFTAVSDANGPRLTVGFVSSHYEFTEDYGGKRLTDEDWQKRFYEGTDTDNAYKYTKSTTWPTQNRWYAPLFQVTK